MIKVYLIFAVAAARLGATSFADVPDTSEDKPNQKATDHCTTIHSFPLIQGTVMYMTLYCTCMYMQCIYIYTCMPGIHTHTLIL